MSAEAPLVRLDARLRRVELPRPWAHDVTGVHLVLTQVQDADGHVGHGFSWTPQVGAEAVLAMLTHDVATVAVGGSTDPGVAWDRAWWALHEAGGGGVTTLALAGLDTALWDLRGRREGRSLVDLLGRRRERVEVYGSGVNLHYDLAELQDQARRWVAAGFGGAKMKVGLPDLAADLERVAAVREILGPDRRLMVDANQRWDLPTALRAARALERFDLDWLEEPLLADDLRAAAELRRRTRVPLAMGESLYTVYQFREAALLGAADVLQPNVVRVGGITPFLRIAELVRSLGVGLAPHLLPDLSGQLALALPQQVLVEDVEDASFAAVGALTGPGAVAVRDGWLTSTSACGPGLGLDLVAPAAVGAER